MRSYKPTDTDIATALADLDAMSDEVLNHQGPKTTIVHFRGHKEIHKTAREATSR